MEEKVAAVDMALEAGFEEGCMKPLSFKHVVTGEEEAEEFQMRGFIKRRVFPSFLFFLLFLMDCGPTFGY